jgi:hypothetical protein
VKQNQPNSNDPASFSPGHADFLLMLAPLFLTMRRIGFSAIFVSVTMLLKRRLFKGGYHELPIRSPQAVQFDNRRALSRRRGKQAGVAVVLDQALQEMR